MAEQHPTDDYTFDESLRTRSRRQVRSEGTNITRTLSGGTTLTRSVGALFVVFIWWGCQHHGPVEDPALASMPHVPTEMQLYHHVPTTCATYEAVVNHPTAMVSLSVPLPSPPVPPAPTPVVPHPVPVVPVVPHPAPVVRYPVPVVPAPTWVVPRPVPVVPAPTPVFPPPVLALEPVPDLVGDDLVTAKQVLVQDGLAIGSISGPESNQPTGTIVQTNPRANTAVPAGTAINLVVAE